MLIFAEFHLFGFLIVLTAAVLSGVRWTFSQTVMQRSQLGLENPVDFMYHIQPVMLITLVPFLGALEGEHQRATGHRDVAKLSFKICKTFLHCCTELLSLSC